MKALSILGLDDNWATSVIAFCGMENAIRKKLEMLGGDPGKHDFQKATDALVERIREDGDNPPDILISLAKAYPEIRGKLVHWGYRNSLYETECHSIVTNTVDLVRTLFELMPEKGRSYNWPRVFLIQIAVSWRRRLSNSIPRKRRSLFRISLRSFLCLNPVNPTIGKGEKR